MEKADYIPLEDLVIYKMAMEVGEIVWNKVVVWDYFAKRTVGLQFVQAADSIASNISEGYGRFHFKDKRTFYYYARGSLIETKVWSVKAINRELLPQKDFEELREKLDVLHKALNQTIKSLPIK